MVSSQQALETFKISRNLSGFYTHKEYISILLIIDPGLALKINNKETGPLNRCVIITGSIRDIEFLNRKPEKSYMVQINSVNCKLDLSSLYLNNIIIDYFDNFYVLDLFKDDLLYQVEGTLSEIENEYRISNILHFKMMKLLTERFFIKFLRFYTKQEKKSFEHYNHHLISSFIKKVNIHYKEKKRLKDYAELLYVSPKTLSNIFLKAGFTSPSKIIKDKIIKEAKGMVHEFPNVSGKEVAFELGYQNPNNFFVLFRNKEGLSFSNYAKNIKKKHQQWPD